MNKNIGLRDWKVSLKTSLGLLVYQPGSREQLHLRSFFVCRLLEIATARDIRWCRVGFKRVESKYENENVYLSLGVPARVCMQ